MNGTVLLWILTAACLKIGRPHMARHVVLLAEAGLAVDNWLEYYDGKLGGKDPAGKSAALAQELARRRSTFEIMA